jgi:hypothetical protein
VYDDPNTTILCQGDVLRRTPELVACIGEYFPYYASHQSYKYFMVVTQTCDLVCRKPGDRPATPYITLAAVRPLSDAIYLEAKKKLAPWQMEAKPKLIRRRENDVLAQFTARLLDNNEPGFFYLHIDPTVGIEEPCCSFLQLTISLREVHYEKLLAAKVAQLKEPFQAKLGWLLGHMYSRVGTTEWSEQPGQNVERDAHNILRQHFVAVRDDQVDEGLADLGNLGGKPPQEIVEYILKKKVLPRETKFTDQAIKIVMNSSKLFDRIQTPVVRGVLADETLKETVRAILAEAGVPQENVEQTLTLLLDAFKHSIKGILKEDAMPEKESIIKKLFAGIMQDATIKNIMK